ncbi:MAG: 23S rRNA (adenine(2503)-C(2))-methyltransferase RlmN [Candidatus Omnitrophota bacterium]
MNKIDLKEFLPEELKQQFIHLNIPVYRTGQVLNWLYHKKVLNFSQMSNLPQNLRALLNEKFSITNLTQVKQLTAGDRTEKMVFSLLDGKLIETVFIPSIHRNTICLSTQVGCPLDCKFCATAKGGFERNLTTGEIIEQILQIESKHDRINNIVFMGMGEALLNYENVLKAVRIINHNQGLNIAARKITISTCGIVPAIYKLSNERLQIELSISLHAADNKLRTKLMPINKKYPLKELIKAGKIFSRRTKRIITFEYILIKGVNDSELLADKLIKLVKGFDCKVNLIAYNPVEKTRFKAPQAKTVENFSLILKMAGIKVFLRRPRGQDIQAGCGQLRSGQIKSTQYTLSRLN